MKNKQSFISYHRVPIIIGLLAVVSLASAIPIFLGGRFSLPEILSVVLSVVAAVAVKLLSDYIFKAKDREEAEPPESKDDE